MKKKDSKNYYLKIISKIEKVRSKNNVNWMGLLRLAFKHAPKDASKLMKKVNSEDKKISFLLHKLSSKKKLSE
jgi:hypothetical protein|tara:strand:+ start:286 stop:504 length:219 start_codon:yes stop_codon:yes gene_type:complete